MLRSPEWQKYHDEVLKIAAGYLNKETYDIYTNPDGEKNTKLVDSYPDIILTRKNNNTVLFVIEVETSDSVNEEEAKQWQKYAALGGTFYLLVPTEKRVQAENLCIIKGISCKFATYWVDQNKVLKVNYE